MFSVLRKGTSECAASATQHSTNNKNVIEKACTDIYGNQLTFSMYTHKTSPLCKEYVFTKEAFNFKKCTLLASVFTAIAFYSELHNLDVNFLGITLLLLFVLLLLKLHLKVKQESLLVIASLGLQLTTTFVTGRKASQFIFQQNIEDVVINEAITMHRVLHYLAVLLKDADGTFGVKSIIPLFQETLPRLDCLEKIYNGVQVAFYMKN